MNEEMNEFSFFLKYVFFPGEGIYFVSGKKILIFPSSITIKNLMEYGGKEKSCSTM